VPSSDTGDRGTNWAPSQPVPADKSKKQGQPRASWDPLGHWDIKTGKAKETIRVRPDGQRVDHWNHPILRWGDPMRTVIENLINHPPPLSPVVPPPILPWVLGIP
jgi:hypothetical protein